MFNLDSNKKKEPRVTMGRFSTDMVGFGTELLVTLVYRIFLVCDELFC